MRSLILFSFVLFLVSCAPRVSSQIRSQGSMDDIIGGNDVEKGSVLSQSIVGIYDAKAHFFCSGSLLPNNVVLTAAHCIDSAPEDVYIIFDGDLMGSVKSKDPAFRDRVLRKATDTRVHPGWDEKANDHKNLNWNDLALIRFAGTIPEGYKPAVFLPNPDLVEKGTTVTVAGYGVSEVKTSKIDPSTYPNLDKAIQDGDVYCNQNKSHCLKVDMSGDGYLRATDLQIAQVHKTEIALDERHGQSTCEGDSGGPVYLPVNGRLYLFALTSRGNELCTGEGIYTNVLAYMDWIEQTIPTLK